MLPRILCRRMMAHDTIPQSQPRLERVTLWVRIIAKCEQRRLADETLSGHASKTLSQAAISPNCNDHVLREQRNIFDIMAFVKRGERRALWYVCQFVWFGCTPATSTVHWAGRGNYSNSGLTFLNILHYNLQGVCSDAGPLYYISYRELQPVYTSF